MEKYGQTDLRNKNSEIPEVIRSQTEIIYFGGEKNLVFLFMVVKEPYSHYLGVKASVRDMLLLHQGLPLGLFLILQVLCCGIYRYAASVHGM